jgi:hypothetical protein
MVATRHHFDAQPRPEREPMPDAIYGARAAALAA